MSADTAPAAMPGDEDVARLVAGVMSRDNHALALHTARKIKALFAPILAEKEREKEAAIQVAEMNATAGAFWAERGKNAEARALAAEAALAAERANTVDGSIVIRLDDKGGIDEIFGNGVLCHIERLDKGHWFIILTRPDQTQEAFWLNGKGKVEFTMHEHRPAPTTGPNVEPWTVAAAIRAQGAP